MVQLVTQSFDRMIREKISRFGNENMHVENKKKLFKSKHFALNVWFWAQLKCCRLYPGRATVWGGLAPRKTADHQHFRVLNRLFLSDQCCLYLNSIQHKPSISGFLLIWWLVAEARERYGLGGSDADEIHCGPIFQGFKMTKNIWKCMKMYDFELWWCLTHL